MYANFSAPMSGYENYSVSVSTHQYSKSCCIKRNDKRGGGNYVSVIESHGFYLKTGDMSVSAEPAVFTCVNENFSISF